MSPCRAGAWIALWILAQSAGAAVISLDQAIGPIPSPRHLVMRDTNLPSAQTFTCGASGRLSQVNLQMYRNNTGVTAPVTLSILPVSPSGEPLWATVLAMTTLNAGDVPLVDPLTPAVGFDFSAANLAVSPGLKLAAALTTTQPYPFLGAPAYIWDASAQNAGLYAGGDAWYRNSGSGVMEIGVPYDYLMHTYVSIPEPGTIAAGALGLAALRRTRFKTASGLQQQ